jgi:hypothetical protein
MEMSEIGIVDVTYRAARWHRSPAPQRNPARRGARNPYSDMFTVVAVATYLKVNRATVYRLMWHHGLQGFRIGAQ